MQGLSYQQATLEILKIKEQYQRNIRYPFVIGSLTEFQKLRNLTIHISVFVGGEVHGPRTNPELPLSLESLTLEGIKTMHFNILETLLQTKKRHIPSLKSIDLGWGITKYPDARPSPDLPDYCHNFEQRLVHDVLEMCKAVNVEMKLIDIPPKFKYITWPRPWWTEVLTWPVVWMDARTVIVRFDYPYLGYEECCIERGYNPEVYRFFPDKFLKFEAATR